MASTQTRAQKAKPASGTRPAGAAVAAKRGRGDAAAEPGSGPALSAQDRRMLIARAAYFRAEKRGFAPGAELQDWIEAEAEVLRLIGES
jgi:hypothetical protein